LRETQAKPRLLVLVASLALAVALLFAALAVFASEARAGSFGSEPPNAVLMKYKSVLQVAGAAGGQWYFYAPPANGEPGGWPFIIYDSFGEFHFPKTRRGGGRQEAAREVPQAGAPQLRRGKRLAEGQRRRELGGKRPAGRKQ